MLYSIDCKANIAEQDATYPTYKSIDCDLHINANDDNFYGTLIDCDLYVLTSLVTACKNWNQGIRTTVTVDGIDVTSALIGTININRKKNQIATFSLQLSDSQYSPLTNSHISPEKEVVIITYLNTHEAALFTGLIDDVNVNWSGDFTININGLGYGKKLRDTRKTLVSIQDSANSKYRGDLIKYLVMQAGIPESKINTLQGSYTRIDHSFEDQSILDMVNKELVIDGMKWEFDENKIFNTSLDIVKTSTGTYPTPDWTYNEDRFFNLGLTMTDDGIINDVKILGTVYETQILVDDADSGSDSPYNKYQYETTLFTVSKSYNDGDVIYSDANSNYTKTEGDFTFKLHSYRYAPHPLKWVSMHIGNVGQNVFQGYEITSIDYAFDGCTFISLNDQVSAGGTIDLHGPMLRIRRDVVDDVMQGFSFTITLKGYLKSSISGVQPTQTDETSPTYDYQYDQVAAHVENIYSIAKYGRRKPNSEGTIEFPLAENTDQCKEIGRKIIKDSHRFTKQPTFEIPFNPMLKVGQTISIIDSKIGYSQRWYVEEVNHTIEQGKGRTRVRCVYYT